MTEVPKPPARADQLRQVVRVVALDHASVVAFPLKVGDREHASPVRFIYEMHSLFLLLPLESPSPTAPRRRCRRFGKGVMAMSGGPGDGILPRALEPIADAAQLRRAFGCFPSGVTAVCAEIAGTPTGMLVSSFTSVSLEPSLASICVAEGSRTWSLLRTAPRLGVSILGVANRSVCQRFSGPGDRFAGVAFTITEGGAVLLGDASAWLDCSVRDKVDAGDHTIVVLQIHALHARPATPPLVFHGSQFHRLSA